MGKQKKKMVQCMLVSDKMHMTTWLENDPRLEVGKFIILKDWNGGPNRFWEVRSISQPRDKSDIKQVWNVGGVNAKRV